MRRLILGLICLCGLTVAAAPFWQSRQQVSVGGAAAPTYVAGASVANINNGFAAGTITFSNLNGGVNFPSGAVVVVGVHEDQGGLTLTSPTIGGNAASLVSGAQDSSGKCTLYFATMAASSTDNFSFTNGNAINLMGVASAYMTGVNGTATTASNETYGNDADPQTPAAAITVPSSGFGIAFLGANNATLTGANAVTWTNTTAAGGDVNSGPSQTVQVNLAHTATSGSWTPTVSGNSVAFSFIGCMSNAAWGL